MSEHTTDAAAADEPRLVYAPPTDTSRAEFDTVMSSGTPAERAQAFLGYVHTEEDWTVTENVCFEFLTDDDPNIRRLAVLFLGYIPRLHGTVHLWRVVPALGRIGRLEDDPTMTYTAEDALGDIAMHMNLVDGRRPYARLPWLLSTAVQRIACAYARHAFGRLVRQQPRFDEDVAHAVTMLLNGGQTRDACSAFAVATAWCIHEGVRLPRRQVVRMLVPSLLVGFPTLAWRDLTKTPPT
jgi:hypothetical protein